ncbi:MAG: hypothetical protein Q8P02_05235, partial [Candidatus Micrarchaeota archaeon]|nr:hypothetical protein [Candidatus Micrarchaeota archaeon]
QALKHSLVRHFRKPLEYTHKDYRTSIVERAGPAYFQPSAFEKDEATMLFPTSRFSIAKNRRNMLARVIAHHVENESRVEEFRLEPLHKPVNGDPTFDSVTLRFKKGTRAIDRKKTMVRIGNVLRSMVRQRRDSALELMRPQSQT